MKFGTCNDAIGVGKTQEIMTAAVAGYWRETYAGNEPKKSTLVAVPNQLLDQTVEELHEHMGMGWNFYRLDNKGSPRYEASITNKPANGNPGGRNVIIIGYNDLARLQVSLKVPAAQLRGIVHRILYDEAHELRGGEHVKTGQAIMPFQAESVRLFSGTIVVDTIADFGAYFAYAPLHARWCAKEDKNLTLPTGQPNMRFQNVQQYYSQHRRAGTPLEGGDPNHPDRDVFTRDQVTQWLPQLGGDYNTLSATDKDLRCQEHSDEYPVKLFTNNFKRKASCEKLSRYIVIRNQADYYVLVYDVVHGNSDVPWHGEAIYEMWDDQNENRFRCLTIPGFNYWILRHIKDAYVKDQKDSLILAIKRASVMWNAVGISRNSKTKYIDEHGTEQNGMTPIPAMHVRRKNLSMGESQKRYYRQTVSEIGADTTFDFTSLRPDEELTLSEVYPERYLHDEEGDDRGAQAARPLF